MQRVRNQQPPTAQGFVPTPSFAAPLFISWVGEVFKGNLEDAAKELRYSAGHLAAVVRGRRPCSVKLARRIKRASEALTPGWVLTMDQLLDPRPSTFLHLVSNQ